LSTEGTSTLGTLRSLLALAGAGWVLAREGVVSALPADPLPPAAKGLHRLAGLVARRRSLKREKSERLSAALNRLGPSWVKLGQFLATRPDVVGADIAGDLELLQDRMRPFPLDDARIRVAQSLGRPVDEVFTEFGEAIAAASVAQVHKAVRARDGVTVAVKVIRPGVRARFRHDLDTFYAAARLQEKHIPSSRRLRPIAVVDTLMQSARIEMDLRLEAAALSELAANIAGDTGFRVPGVDWELTGRDCLTMEWIDGIKLTEVEAITAAGHDVRHLAATLVQSFLRQTLRDGFFHADMHPGNLFVDPKGDIVAVDLGIAGRIGLKERRFLAEILYGFIKRDYRRVAEVHFEAGYVPRTKSVDSFAQALRSIGEPIHGRPLNELSLGKLLAQLFETTRAFDMTTQPQLLLLQKTMVAAEGIAHVLDPKVNLWDVAAPLLETWLRDNIGPDARLRDMAVGVADLARRMPAIMERMGETAETLSKGEIRLAPDNTRIIAREIAAEQNRLGVFGRVPFWVAVVLAGALIIAIL